MNTEPFDLEDAFDAFTDLNLAYGDTVSHDVIWDILGLVRPGPNSTHEWAEKQKLLQVARFKCLRMAVLERKFMDLVSVPSLGYKIPFPQEQAPLAHEHARKRARTALSLGRHRASHVDRESLTDAQRREQADIMARLAKYHGMLRKPRGGW